MKAIYGRSFRIGRGFHWFISANFARRYGAASNYALNQDLSVIYNSNSFTECIDELYEWFKWKWYFKKSEFNQTTSNKRAYRLILYLALFHRGAKDWFTGDRIGFIDRVDDWTRDYKPEWHHIFPKAIVKSKKGLFVRDSIANFTAINKKTNRAIRDRKPIDYLTEVPLKQLKAHMVPVEEELWKRSKFVDFVNERAQKLARGINRFINETGGTGLGK